MPGGYIYKVFLDDLDHKQFDSLDNNYTKVEQENSEKKELSEIKTNSINQSQYLKKDKREILKSILNIRYIFF